jgi:hypothetical protein
MQVVQLAGCLAAWLAVMWSNVTVWWASPLLLLMHARP